MVSSTVVGRFKITLRLGVAPQAAVTASHTSKAKSSSVPVKVSGLYSSWISVSGMVAAISRTSFTPATAISRTSSRLMLKTMSRKGLEVAL